MMPDFNNNKYNKYGNVGDSENSLQYKDHSEYFEEFFLLRKKFNTEMALSLFDNNLLKSCYVILVQFREWSYSQTDKVNDENSNYEKELNEALKFIKNQEYSKARDKMKTIYRKLSIDHEKAELTPKVKFQEEDENEKFWKDEQHAAVKEMKKAFYDVLMYNN